MEDNLNSSSNTGGERTESQKYAQDHIKSDDLFVGS
jgi:hypothetical protein